jgi:hypothetical protein
MAGKRFSGEKSSTGAVGRQLAGLYCTIVFLERIQYMQLKRDSSVAKSEYGKVKAPMEYGYFWKIARH